MNIENWSFIDHQDNYVKGFREYTYFYNHSSGARVFVRLRGRSAVKGLYIEAGLVGSCCNGFIRGGLVGCTCGAVEFQGVPVEFLTFRPTNWELFVYNDEEAIPSNELDGSPLIDVLSHIYGEYETLIIVGEFVGLVNELRSWGRPWEK